MTSALFILQVQIHINDVNDNAPTWLFPPDPNLVINMTIYEPVGHQVAQFRANDRDYAENGDVIYQIVHFSILSSANMASTLTEREHLETKPLSLNKTTGALDGIPFELDASTGALYIARALSMQDMGLVKIIVEASDLGTPPKSTHRTVLFNILDYSQPQKVVAASADSYEGAAQENVHKTTNRNFEGQDIIIVTIMIAVAIFIALFLIIAMVFLQCPICRRRRQEINYHSATCGTNHKTPSPAAGVELHYSIPRDPHSYYYAPEVFRDSHSLISLVGGGTRPGDTTVGKENSLGSSAYSYDGHDDISGDNLVYPAILQLSEDGQSATILEAPKVPTSAVQSGFRFGDITASFQKNLSTDSTKQKRKKESIRLLPLSAKLERSQVMFIDQPECSSFKGFRHSIKEAGNSNELSARIENNNEVHDANRLTPQEPKNVGVQVSTKKQPTISWMEPESSICFLDSDVPVNFELQEGSSDQTAKNSHQSESRLDLDAGNGYARLGRRESISYDGLIHESMDKSELYTDFQNTVI
ncbi:unnamed protein product [Schistocephalus solidus]|uniref:CA domain-containing protein n=1 Tax=Schistocephalus solidus TaxID=70667 RepID=A0A183SJ00_SCHSO|nr:unnamed protein product [Schistocephalus solidus]